MDVKLRLRQFVSAFVCVAEHVRSSRGPRLSLPADKHVGWVILMYGSRYTSLIMLVEDGLDCGDPIGDVLRGLRVYTATLGCDMTAAWARMVFPKLRK